MLLSLSYGQVMAKQMKWVEKKNEPEKKTSTNGTKQTIMSMTTTSFTHVTLVENHETGERKKQNEITNHMLDSPT